MTSPRAHPFNIEWLRFEPDSPVTGPLRTQPHVAYRVADVDSARKATPSSPSRSTSATDPLLTVAFVDIDGAVVEFMQYANPDEEGWF